MKDKLTEKELRFSIAYASGMSIKDSVIKAGYKEKNANQIGYKLMNGDKKSLIEREIAKRREDLQLSLGVTKQSVLADLIRLYNQALEADSHGVCKDILKLLGGELGLFKEGKMVQHQHQHQLSFENILQDMDAPKIIEKPMITVN